MKILIDGQTLSTPDINRGIGEVLLNILYNMVETDQISEFFIAVYDDCDKKPIMKILNKVHLISLGSKLDTDRQSRNEYNSQINKIITDENIDIFWVSNPMMQNVNLVGSKPRCRTVVTFYDLIPLVFEKQYLVNWPSEIKEEYFYRLSLIDEISDLIISISNCTKYDLVSFLKIEPNKIKTVYLGIKDLFINNHSINNKSTLKYILYVGGFDSRKNMEYSVLAFKRLVEKYGHDDLYYTIVCACNEDSTNIFLKFVQKQNIAEQVILTGYISDEELIDLYAHAEAFFFPSLYEGFGLPVLEALALGVPIAASNESSIPEVVDDAGLLFDPTDLDDMADKLHSILSDKE